MPESPTTRVETADVLAIDDAVTRSTGGGAYGLTEAGFTAKPYARLIAEKLALARALFGDDLDLTSGSAIRKLLEVSALEDARTWAALASVYDDSFVSTASGQALSRLGEELGLPRPQEQASGTVRLVLSGDLPAGAASATLPRGVRLLSPGGHHAALDETVTLSPTSPDRDAAVVAFHPGPGHNLDPSSADAAGDAAQALDRFHPLDPAVAALFGTDEVPVTVEHTEPLVGGEAFWPDERYRALLLRAPRSLWTVEAVEIAVSLVPGVRRVQVRDAFGGLDIRQSIFGNFNFIERLFATERDLASPYYFSVLIAPTPAAIWAGPDGLRASVESAVEDVRPVSIFPRIERAREVGVGVSAKLVVRGVPLPAGSRATVNASEAARALKDRLMDRLRRSVETLGFGEPVRASEAVWALMSEPGVTDVLDVRLLRYPPSFDAARLGAGAAPEAFPCGENVPLQADEVPVYVDDPSALVIV